MKAHPRVLGYLGRALSHELSAVQQYLTHAALAEMWDLGDAAKHFAQEALDEQEHAARLTRRMLELGAIPNRSQLTPTRVGANLGELLDVLRTLELRAVEIYREASHFCTVIDDQPNRELFTELMHEELKHAHEVEAWMWQLQQPQTPAPNTVNPRRGRR